MKDKFGSKPKVFMSWLRSGEAISAHAVFLLMIGLLASELLAGNAGPAGDYPLGLLFCVVAYPVVLLLFWVRSRIDG